MVMLMKVIILKIIISPYYDNVENSIRANNKNKNEAPNKKKL